MHLKEGLNLVVTVDCLTYRNEGFPKELWCYVGKIKEAKHKNSVSNEFITAVSSEL